MEILAINIIMRAIVREKTNIKLYIIYYYYTNWLLPKLLTLSPSVFGDSDNITYQCYL